MSDMSTTTDEYLEVLSENRRRKLVAKCISMAETNPNLLGQFIIELVETFGSTIDALDGDGQQQSLEIAEYCLKQVVTLATKPKLTRQTNA